VLRLATTDAKGGDARIFPFGCAPPLQELLEVQWGKRHGGIVFQHRAKHIGSCRRVWTNACRRAGIAGRLVHDLRRTAARDLRRADVSDGEITKLSGWKTRSMFDRYNLQLQRQNKRQTSRVPLRTPTR